MTTARWYFDLVSPYAYLHLKKFGQLPADLNIEYVPILLAGLLGHWGQKGPAEIAPKRRYAYRQIVWLAKHQGIPLQMPPQHPFNPLHALRLLVAAGPTRKHVEAAFEMVWKEGRDLQSRDELMALGQHLGVADVDSALTDAHIKQRLRDNTDEAIRNGVFGVPTFLVGAAMFWGQDSLEMMRDYLHDPGIFDTPEMRRLDSLPVGVRRRE